MVHNWQYLSLSLECSKDFHVVNEAQVAFKISNAEPGYRSKFRYVYAHKSSLSITIYALFVERRSYFGLFDV